jgi:hypothetical protein
VRETFAPHEFIRVERESLRLLEQAMTDIKSLPCLKVALRAHGTHRHAAEIQLLQQLADAAPMQMNMEFGGRCGHPVRQAPRTTPSVMRSGPSSILFAASLNWLRPGAAGAQVGREHRLAVEVGNSVPASYTNYLIKDIIR